MGKGGEGNFERGREAGGILGGSGRARRGQREGTTATVGSYHHSVRWPAGACGRSGRPLRALWTAVGVGEWLPGAHEALLVVGSQRVSGLFFSVFAAGLH